MTARILEIFSSIQGEGAYAGTRQVFVRFFECNMHCVWCDTPHSIGDTTRHYVEYSTDELEAAIRAESQRCHSVTFTGGEPLLQSEAMAAVIPRLKDLPLRTHCDTNGTLPKKLSVVIDHLDVIAMDIKMPSSTGQRAYWDEHEAFLKIAARKEVFIKAVVSKNTAAGDIEKTLEIIRRVAPETLLILQPNFFEIKDGAVERCLEFYDLCQPLLQNVRVLPQAHKILKVR